MFGLSLGFTAPWVLIALGALPVLWVLLRAVPPAPIRRRFPGVVLLLGLEDKESVMDRTPWWLLLLRMVLIACAIVAFAGPILNPKAQGASNRPLLVVLDGTWASAPEWRRQSDVVVAALQEADRQQQEAAILRLTAPEQPDFLPASVWTRRVTEFEPQPWQPNFAKLEPILDTLSERNFDTLWVSDGLVFGGRIEVLEALEARGEVRVVQSDAPVFALHSLSQAEGVLTVQARASVPVTTQKTVSILGTDPSGVERLLAQGVLDFTGEPLASAEFALPSELRGRITQFEMEGVSSAGARYLTDDSIRRREIGVVQVGSDREGLELLSPTHYLRQALIETADLIDGPVSEILPANPDVMILADIPALAPDDEAALAEWVEAGGLLLRFAGPQMAASDLSRDEEHPLMPVRLRVGGRTVGGAMSWGEPKALAPFAANSPFKGLSVPEDVRVTAQVVAQPDPNLADRVLAELSDGTPLVTRKTLGQGQVVLFHVTANAEWSGLPLSGLFVQMLDRLAVLSAAGEDQAAAMEGTNWQPVRVLTGSGRLIDGQSLVGVEGSALLSEAVGPNMRAGLYRDGVRSFARNVLREDDVMEPFVWPAHVPVSGYETPATKELTVWFLTAALVLLMVDTLVSLMLSGRLRGFGLAALALVVVQSTSEAQAQSVDHGALADEIALAYVVTGDSALDALSHAGLLGLSTVLNRRTAIEPVAPRGVNLETDELAFFPFLYWPVSADQPVPSPSAYDRVNTYLRSGGMILFDTRDSDLAGFGVASPNGRKLQILARALDIPPLEPVPSDHVLTRTFYLLQDFPGRHSNRDVWVEAAPPDAEQVEGMPFRNLNDGVTPVVIGGNDWASAWATDARGVPLYPVGRGVTGERQRELAYRFGVNLITHVLTGNYKSDQVHVPALLDRLGQ